MARLAVLYSSKTGQTLKIAACIADRLRTAGHTVDLHDAGDPPSAEQLTRIDGVVIGSWVRGGRHIPAVKRFVESNRELLGRVPSAFFSVSLLQLSTRPTSRTRAAGYLTGFLARTGWQPTLTASFAGAMLYTRLGWLGRRIERAAWRKEGIDSDITRDHEFTRWEEVDRFADEFARAMGRAAPSL